MENILRYYEFSDFFIDKSGVFSGNKIAFTELNEQHFLIFEKKEHIFNLYISKYSGKSEIGIKAPEILELLANNYDKSLPEHRIILRQYID